MLVLLVAALATSCALPMVVFVLRWRSIVDVPNQRSSHAKPVYRGGGLACLVGVACGLAVAQLRGDSVLWGASAVAVGIGIVGLIDDIRALIGGSPPDAAGHGTLIARLRAAEHSFEATHPTLSGVISGLIDILGQMGI